MHIEGRANHTADFLSRHFLNNLDTKQLSKYDTFKTVHNARSGHRGIKRTLDMFKRYAPNYTLTFVDVRAYVESCGYASSTSPIEDRYCEAFLRLYVRKMHDTPSRQM